MNKGIFTIVLALVAVGCGDKAAPKLKECTDAEQRGDFKAAVAACEAAASLDPASQAGKEAHSRIDKLQEKQKRKEADERAAELTKQAKSKTNALDDLKAKQDDAAKKVQDLEKAVGAPGSDDEKERLRKQLEEKR
jgi:uncharacterized protein YlxW (UPF0749 family)